MITLADIKNYSLDAVIAIAHFGAIIATGIALGYFGVGALAGILF